jgi:hypothetical protein
MRAPSLRPGAMLIAGTLAASSLVTLAASPALALAVTDPPAAPAALTAVVINEIESKDGVPGDWVELKNASTVPVDASGLVLSDSKGTPSYTVPTGTIIAADGYLVLDEAAFGFGLGGEDLVRLYDTDGTTVVDEHAWTEHSPTTLGRCPDGTGPFATTASPTKGAANDCATPGTTADLVVNEVESNGDDTDWVELTTTGTGPVDISGFTFRDDDDARTPYTLPAGSVVEPSGFFVIDQVSGSNPVGFDFGLGNADAVRLYDTTGTLVADYSWTVHSLVSYGRCPDGTGDMTTTTVSTKGAPNDCSSPVRVNEVSTSGDWVELTSIGASAVPLDGYTLTATDGTGTTGTVTVSAGTSLAPAGFLALDLPLASAGTLQLRSGNGTVVDEHTWTAEPGASYGRCPDGTGDITTTLAATRGTANTCEGVLTPQPWPGGPDEVPLDAVDTFSGDLSGLDYEPSGSAAPGTLWAVQNGDGLLYKIVADGNGGWAPTTAAGWSAGKTLRYTDGGGAVDAEGVTVAADSSGGGVYVSTERNNDQSSVSRPSVLRYDVTGDATTLVATDEWNLAADFPGLGANAGLEGITWVPDTFLTAQGFVDQRTGSAYAPASYPGHGDGLFVVGVEGTAGVYAYALLDDGSFVRVAAMETPFDLVADVQFDADLDALWVACDEACSGRTALFEIDDAGAFTATTVYEAPAAADTGLANEGFAIADAATCVDGSRATFYADDNDTDGYSLRAGTFPCAKSPTEPGEPGEPTPGEPGQPVPGEPAPGTPGTPGSPAPATTPVDTALLTDATRGSIAAPTTAVPGQAVTITVDPRYAGQTVYVWLHSEPRLLGSPVVAADGTVRVTIPADVPVGLHRLVVLDSTGAIIGWQEIEIVAAAGAPGRVGGRSAATGPLASTGLDGRGAVLAAMVLVLAGATVLAARRPARRDRV